MMTKETKVYQIEVTENNTIQVRTVTRFMEAGVQLSQTYHRHCLSPGDDLTGNDDKVVLIARVVWGLPDNAL